MVLIILAGTIFPIFHLLKLLRNSSSETPLSFLKKRKLIQNRLSKDSLSLVSSVHLVQHEQDAVIKLGAEVWFLQDHVRILWT